MKTPKNKKEYPKGYFVGLWIGIGMALWSGLGVPISVALDDFSFIGVGPGIGLAFGAFIGQSIENKHFKEGQIRPLTPEEKRTRKTLVIAATLLFLAGIAVFLMI